MEFEIQIAVATPLHQTFTYLHREPLAAGVRVLVPFGSQPRTLGVVVEGPKTNDLETASEAALKTGEPAQAAQAAPKEPRKFKLKSIKEVLDPDPVYSPVLLRLAKWMAQYYMHPLGEVLRTMLPASSTKTVKVTFEITETGSRAPVDESFRPGEFFARKKTAGLPTLKKKFKDRGLETKASDELIKKWLQKGWMVVAKEKTIQTRKLTSEPRAHAAEFCRQELFQKLNERQEAAFTSIISQGFSTSKQVTSKPFLLFGVTGSGKTEVFLHAIREAIECSKDSLKADGTVQSAQALVLVPEISLTPQMTRIFEERFPGHVAVVHSALDDRERWQQLDRVRRGEACVLIGPRSAVFGSFANLKLIIVDEEHDGSYKQGNGLLYNARDVAVVRAGMENISIVMGSATPSMESWNNAITGKYQLLEMPDRASTKPLPDVETVPSKPAFKSMALVRGDAVDDGDSPFADEVISALQANLAKGHQSIVLVNRRGYAYYMLCVEDRKAAGCPHCSISLSVHGRRKTLRCHYCDYTTTMQNIILENPSKTWAVVGYGSQKAEDFLCKAMPSARISRLDSDTVQDPHVLPETLGKFRNGELDILVGTQILAKGHDFPNVTLVAILEVDQLLGLPDFRGGERTFQLLVQAAGRSGRGTLPGKVIVQSMRGNHPVVQSALKQDFRAFAKDELSFRQTMGYPPFGRMILFEFHGPDVVKLDHWCKALENKLLDLLSQHPELERLVKVLGPAPAPIEVIRGRSRRTIMILSSHHAHCRTVSTALAAYSAKPPTDIRVKIDVDPQSTL
jgi:primosomal protein N' (replication factor Y) (superfamily II helicase)